MFQIGCFGWYVEGPAATVSASVAMAFLDARPTVAPLAPRTHSTRSTSRTLRTVRTLFLVQATIQLN